MKKITIILLAIFSLSTSLHALVYIIPDGETRTTTLDLPDDGDRAIVEEGGAIAPAAGEGITMNGNNQSATNHGRITTSDRAIDNVGGMRSVLINNGQIFTTGGFSFGLNDTGTNVSMTNNGLISTTGNDSHGLHSVGTSALMINRGRILTAGTTARGMLNRGNDTTMINSGFILTEATNSSGMADITGNNCMMINSGSILVTGDTSRGMRINSSTDSTIINSGLITATGTGGVAIADDGPNTNSHIINSGTLIAPSTAIIMSGTDITLTLLRGSNIQGLVSIAVDPVALNVETGLNLALSHSGAFGFDNFGITAPFVSDGSTVAVLDPTGLAMQADIVADLSDTILDGIYRRKTAFSCQCTPCGCGAWIQGIGSSRKRSHSGDNVGYDNWQGGALIGYDTPLCNGYGSLFFAVSSGQGEIDQKTQVADTISYVGGASYEQLFCNGFFGAALALGYVDWDNRRYVMNNQVNGGVEKATADMGGFFISPEITLAYHFSTFCFACPIASFTLRYAGLFLGDYSEKGSETNLSVKDRDINLLTTRFEVALPYTASFGICCWAFEPYVGVFGRYQFSNHVDGEFFGQAISFDPGGPRNVGALLVGARATQAFGCLNLFLNIEASFDNYDSTRILGEGGIGIRF